MAWQRQRAEFPPHRKGVRRTSLSWLSDHRYAIFFLRITGVWSHPVSAIGVPLAPTNGSATHFDLDDGAQSADAQKLSPVKFRVRPRKFRAIETALLPLIKPTTLDTENFGGMLMHM